MFTPLYMHMFEFQTVQRWDSAVEILSLSNPSEICRHRCPLCAICGSTYPMVIVVMISFHDTNEMDYCCHDHQNMEYLMGTANYIEPTRFESFWHPRLESVLVMAYFGAKILLSA